MKKELDRQLNIFLQLNLGNELPDITIEELSYFPKIKDADQEFEFQLLDKDYKLAEPIIKERDAVYQLSTYSSDLYIPAQLSQKKKGKTSYLRNHFTHERDSIL